MSVGLRTWAAVGPQTFDDLRQIYEPNNFLLAAHTSERIHCVLFAIAFLANAAQREGVSFVEPHTRGTQIVPRPHGVELGHFLNISSTFPDILVPAHRTDSGFNHHVQLVVKAIEDDRYSCTGDGARPDNGFCVKLVILNSERSWEYKAEKYYKLEIEIPHAKHNREFHKFRVPFCALFRFVRKVFSDSSGTVLMTVSGFWYSQLPLPRDISSFPLTGYLLRIAASAVHIAGLTEQAGSIAYGAVTWRVQRQFAGIGPAARISKKADEGGFIVGCQLTELVNILHDFTSREPYSRFKFLVVSDVFSSIGRTIGKADSTYGPTDRVIMVMKKALSVHVGEFVLMADLLGGIQDLDEALGIPGVNKIFRHDSRGATPAVPSSESLHFSQVPNPLPTSLCAQLNCTYLCYQG
jgi:hypothetical protein